MKQTFAGYEFHFPAGAKVRIRDIRGMQTRSGQEHYSAETVATFIADSLGQKGLILLDEDNPIPMDEAKRISLTTMRNWIKQQVRYFNELNQAQASENLKTILPSEELRNLTKVLDRLNAELKDFDAEGANRIVSEDELAAIASKAELRAMGVLERVKSAVETGDIDAIKAAVGDMAFGGSAGKAAAASLKRASDTVLAGEGADENIMPVERPVGRGAGRVPTRARVAGAPGMRRGGGVAEG
jgi:hypothetical protein